MKTATVMKSEEAGEKDCVMAAASAGGGNGTVTIRHKHYKQKFDLVDGRLESEPVRVLSHFPRERRVVWMVQRRLTRSRWFVAVSTGQE